MDAKDLDYDFYKWNKEIDEKDVAKMKQCAESCPVNAIKVEEIKE